MFISEPRVDEGIQGHVRVGSDRLTVIIIVMCEDVSLLPGPIHRRKAHTDGAIMTQKLKR